MSAPAAKAFSLPVSRIAPMPASASNASSASPSSAIRPGLSAFSCFGRLRVMTPTRPFCSAVMNSKLMSVDNLCVEAVERGEERGVHLPRGNLFPAVALRARRAGVGEQGDLVAEVGGVAHAGVHAHVRHHPGDHQVFDLLLLEYRPQVGIPEAVREVLLDHRFTTERLYRLVDLRALRARQEKSITWTHGQMAHVNDRFALLAEFRDRSGRLGASRVGSLELHRAA